VQYKKKQKQKNNHTVAIIILVLTMVEGKEEMNLQPKHRLEFYVQELCN